MNKLIKLLLALIIAISISGCFNLGNTRSTIITRMGTDSDGVEMCAQKMKDGSYSSLFKCPS